MARYVLVLNKNRSIQVQPRIKCCDTFVSRLKGLMFQRTLSINEGLLLVIAKDSRLDSSIHMLFVSFDLAVFWINSDMRVVDKVIAKSWRPAYFPTDPACYTLEITPAHFGDYEIGDKVEFRNA
jgi:uncharacterized membrane protein (UPF0127 family)